MERAEKRVFTLKLIGNSVRPCSQMLITWNRNNFNQTKKSLKKKEKEGERELEEENEKT